MHYATDIYRKRTTDTNDKQRAGHDPDLYTTEYIYCIEQHGLLKYELLIKYMQTVKQLSMRVYVYHVYCLQSAGAL